MNTNRRLSNAVNAVLLMLVVQGSWAVPSFSRQTGYECSKCHTVFPELTPYGRQFKLAGFTPVSDSWSSLPTIKKIPVAVLLNPSWGETRNINTPAVMPDSFSDEHKLVAEGTAVYLAGRYYDKVGGLIQYNYNGFEHRPTVTMFDLRYADTTFAGNAEVDYGLSVNNNPTFSDIYNSTPAYSFPYGGGKAQMPPAALIDSTLNTQAAGFNAYALWDDFLYTDIGVYRNTENNFLRAVTAGVSFTTVLQNYAPYWRVALQKETGTKGFEIGAFGLNGKPHVDPNNLSAGTNLMRDIGVDASYECIQADHTLSAHAIAIHERQHFDPSLSQNDTVLNTYRIDGIYHYRRQWGGGAQYFVTTGSSSAAYNTGDPVMGSSAASPLARGYVLQLDYLPLQQVKISLRYTLFSVFNGAGTNYTPGRNASDNNFLYLNSQILF